MNLWILKTMLSLCSILLVAFIFFTYYIKLSQNSLSLPLLLNIFYIFNGKQIDQTINKNLEKKINKLENELEKLNNYLPMIFTSVRKYSPKKVKRILVSGGAGFVGSNLVDELMLLGNEVIVVDNFHTGRKINIDHWIKNPNFTLIKHDIVIPLYIDVDEIYHLASPASPKHYMLNPVKTIKTNTIGTLNLLGLAKRLKAKILLASSSEVYGNPKQHPQKENYFGNVNPVGPRSCYDEGKRIAESLSYAYAEKDNLQIRIARIFNTYGPRMLIEDGRVVSNFISQALRNNSITIYGNGHQTRSFQYVSDLVNGLISLMNSNVSEPINLGNPEEYTIINFAKIVKNYIPGVSKFVFMKEIVDDPKKRKPDITKAKLKINWEPKVTLKDGLQITIKYFKDLIQQEIKNHHKKCNFLSNIYLN